MEKVGRGDHICNPNTERQKQEVSGGPLARQSIQSVNTMFRESCISKEEAAEHPATAPHTVVHGHTCTCINNKREQTLVT